MPHISENTLPRVDSLSLLGEGGRSTHSSLVLPVMNGTRAKLPFASSLDGASLMRSPSTLGAQKKLA